MRALLIMIAGLTLSASGLEKCVELPTCSIGMCLTLANLCQHTCGAWADGTCDFNACIPHPCAEGVECIDIEGPNKDASGRSCGDGPCTGVDCRGNGECSESTGLCQCNPAFSGASCEKEDLCFEKTCSANGVCNPLTGQCVCNNGFSGAQCESEDPCHDEDCNGNGECVVSGPDSFSCQCEEGFTGPKCKDDVVVEEVDACDNHPCANDGGCTDLNDSMFNDPSLIDTEDGRTCDCSTTRFTGKNCDEEYNACDTFPCLNNGECFDVQFGAKDATGRTCKCVGSWVPPNCEKDYDACMDYWCLGDNAEGCEDIVGGPMDETGRKCICKDGWKGAECEIEDGGGDPDGGDPDNGGGDGFGTHVCDMVYSTKTSAARKKVRRDCRSLYKNKGCWWDGAAKKCERPTCAMAGPKRNRCQRKSFEWGLQCIFNPQTAQCIDGGVEALATIPCSFFTKKTTCKLQRNADSNIRCIWRRQIPWDKVPPKDDVKAQCLPIESCKDTFRQINCKNRPFGQKCNWFEGECHEQSCATVTRDECLAYSGPGAPCQLNRQDHVKVRCESVVCEKLTRQYNCAKHAAALNCKWLNFARKCKEIPAGNECSIFENAGPCRSYDGEGFPCEMDTVNGVCAALQCSFHIKKGRCNKEERGGVTCAWDDEAKVCNST